MRHWLVVLIHNQQMQLFWLKYDECFDNRDTVEILIAIEIHHSHQGDSQQGVFDLVMQMWIEEH